MARKKNQPKPMTLDEAIQYGTADYLELTSSWLGATPEMPGGCETIARFSLGKGRRLISVDLLESLAVKARATTDLLEALEEVCAELNKYENTPHPEGAVGARSYLVKLMHARAAIARAKGEK